MKTKEEVELRYRRHYMNNLPFCPDHRDKVKDKPCRECEIERLRIRYKALWNKAELLDILQGTNHFQDYPAEP